MRLLLRFDASQAEPDLQTMFMRDGGPINAAVMRGDTDFAVTGSKGSVHLMLRPPGTHGVEIEVPDTEYYVDKGEVVLNRRTKLHACMSRNGPAINGPTVSSVSGRGAPLKQAALRKDCRLTALCGHAGHKSLLSVLRASDTHSQIGMEYASWGAYAATLGVSNARLVKVEEDGSETPVSRVRAQEVDKERKTVLEQASAALNSYAERCYVRRSKHLVYKPVPMLTKPVFHDAVGVNGQGVYVYAASQKRTLCSLTALRAGYSPVHDIMDRRSQLPDEVLDSLFKASILAELGNDVNAYERFMAGTAFPGGRAAEEAQTLASATSILVNFLIAYRADGRNAMTKMGPSFEDAESWLRQVPRSPIEANDCDGSMLEAVGALTQATKIAAADSKKFPHLNAAKNVILPLYTVVGAVVGATAGEATSAGKNGTHVAGHAIALLIPTLTLLRAMEAADAKKIDGNDLVPEEVRQELAEARFRALFDEETKELLMKDYQDMDLSTWSLARDAFKGRYVARAIEGTTPSSAVLHTKNDSTRKEQRVLASLDDEAMARMGSNVFRAFKRMHVGGSVSGHDHRFYREIVEITVPRSSPLFSDPALRSMGFAASQFVLAPASQCGTDLNCSGVSPQQLVEEDFVSVPLATFPEADANALQIAGEASALDVIPRRTSSTMKLTEFQTENLKRSLDALHSISDKLRFGEGDGQVLTYIVAFSTLVHSPNSVKFFCNSVAKHATCVELHDTVVRGIALDVQGNEAGHFISLGIVVPV